MVSNIIFSGHQASIQNSTFINLGRNANRPGLLIQEATSVSVSDSTFIDTYRGLTFKDSMNIVIQNCSFKEFSKEYSEAIRGDRCNNIAIENCTFANMSNTTFGITLKSSTNTNITDCDFKDYGLLGIGIGSDQYYSYNQNITLLGNSFREGLFGIFITGMHVSINENSFNNLQITGMILRGLFIEVLNNSFVDLGRGIVFSSPYYTLVGATNTIVKDNVFTDILNEAILISNYDGVTLFSFETNNITNIGTAFAFEGNLGGESETVRSQITGNIIRNTTNYAITGTYWDNLARLQHIMINLNAFIDCKPDYTSFETDYYYFIDILWDDGIFGNYWGEVNTTSNNDEDSNLINDDFYVINAIHGQVDFAPLLSTRYIFEDDPIGTSHPSDFTRTQKELTVNNTLEWKVNRLRDLTIQIWVNNESSSDYTNTTNSVKFELDKLNDGLHNITLVVSNDTIFRDSVWVTILPPETNLFSDILIPLGTISFIIAIVAVFSYGFLKKRR